MGIEALDLNSYCIRVLKNNDFHKYDQLINKADSSYVFQTREYLGSLSKLGYDYEIVGIFENDDLIYALPIQKKKFPLLKRYYYSIPYGIVSIRKTIPNDVLELFLVYLKKKGLLIKLSVNEKIDLKSFKLNGSTSTLMIDLSIPLSEIFNNFSKTHRNCTRRALKEGVRVDFEDNDEILDAFIELYEQLVLKKSIDSIPIDFLRDVLGKLIKSKLGFFAVARYGDIIQNMAFITTLGKQARYLYGASLRVVEKVPPIGQYLHYEIIRKLQENGFSTYDLGGIPNLPVLEDDSAYSVYKFKNGFGGDPVVLCYDYYYFKYRIFKYLIR